ncbi:hypothetical protein GH714_033174 [Hevea brasiliensis]|uniref:BTB domain-containing protein n=1 Tax=Hevea brasiliensis TaxID=3981 RepID=A0A6A6L7C5_HEVBR|nr:hypothetical protein GH714_033174 [Hevea brasiliensis]
MDEICDKKGHPVPPLLPGPATTNGYHRRQLTMDGKTLRGHSSVSTRTKDMWERLFDEGYRADVTINTDKGGSIYAHANILGMASPVIKGLLKQAKSRTRQRSISIRGVPHDAVRVFIRFLYSLLELKKICVHKLEQSFLTTENVVDIFQLALLCDAPRLSLICHRMIVSNFQEISTTEGWKAMQQSHPVLEKELLDSMVDVENRQKERIRKLNERKIYLQLYEAMEALVHICRDGCRTIDHMIKISEGLRHLALIQHARDWNCWCAISQVAS